MHLGPLTIQNKVKTVQGLAEVRNDAVVVAVLAELSISLDKSVLLYPLIQRHLGFQQALLLLIILFEHMSQTVFHSVFLLLELD